jgi:hypothetical protein
MKQCPACKRTYTDDALLFCLEDGTQLQSFGATQSSNATAETLISYDPDTDPNKTLAFNPARDTIPPPTNPYPSAPSVSQTPPAPSWSPTPQYRPAPLFQPARKSGGKGWIIAVIAGVVALGIGVIIFLTVGRESSTASTNSGSPVAKNSNAATTNTSTTINANRGNMPPPSNSLKDDFSTENWPTGDAAYNSFYQDGEYHMQGKPNLYVYMFPRNIGSYASKDATVKVTARSVTSRSPEYGYGLIVHGRISKSNKLEGYGFLLYTGTPAKYEIVRFTDGDPKAEVSWTPSSAIRSGTSPNQIEVRTSGPQLSLYVNGQFVRSITDTVGFTEGFVGLYTSETNEVAFDDMEIERQ